MGCCVSTATTKSNSLPPLHSPQSEEEKVKEVLTETPTIPKPTNYTNTTPTLNEKPNIIPTKEQKHHIVNKPTIPRNNNNNNNNVSETEHACACSVSEICSSSSDNIPTTDKKLPRHRSPAKHRAGSDPARSLGSSPARRPDSGRRPDPMQSPGRVRSDTRGPRRDSGESSGRRSRSPGMRSETGPGVGRSPSIRKTGRSPGRVRSELGDRGRKRELNDACKWPPHNNEKESLENPLVSLECFIFL